MRGWLPLIGFPIIVQPFFPGMLISKRSEIELRGNGRVRTAPRMVRSGSGDVDVGKLVAEDGCIYAQAGKGLGGAMSGV